MGRDNLAVLVQTSTIHRGIPEESSGAQAPSSLRLSTHFLPPGAGGGAGGQAQGAQERGPAPAAQEPGAGGAEDQPPPGALHLQVRLGPIPVGQRGWEEERDGWDGSKVGVTELWDSTGFSSWSPVGHHSRNSSPFAQQQRGICWKLLQRRGVASQEAGVAI